MDQQQNKRQPSRSQDDYLDLSRRVFINHWRTEASKSKGKSGFNKIKDFLTSRFWDWIYYYLSSRFGPDWRYQPYPAGETGVYEIDDGKAVIAIAADWGTDTPESYEVAREMLGHNPDYTIHLGDTYYVGAPHEIRQNFVDAGSPWVRGSKGSFAVLGNHEMYARGIAFFKYQLETLGLKNADGKYTGQKAGFFCLENEYWRILGLDTGYHSIGKIPILELLPWFAPDCHFDDILIDWLYKELKLDDSDDKRGLVIMTHHQYITAFAGEGEFLVPAEQLAAIIGKYRPVIWLWGHEHKLSVFEKVQVGEGITAYGRCIGHGGMPIQLYGDAFKIDKSTHGYDKLVLADKRVRQQNGGCPLGYNGYALLTLDDEKLDIGYHDVDKLVLSESWTVDIKTGAIYGEIHKPDGSELETIENKALSDAVS
jgi:hypothetical protein